MPTSESRGKMTEEEKRIVKSALISHRKDIKHLLQSVKCDSAYTALKKKELKTINGLLENIDKL